MNILVLFRLVLSCLVLSIVLSSLCRLSWLASSSCRVFTFVFSCFVFSCRFVFSCLVFYCDCLCFCLSLPCLVLSCGCLIFILSCRAFLFLYCIIWVLSAAYLCLARVLSLSRTSCSRWWTHSTLTPTTLF
jgi:hypothetical protein